MKLKSTLYKVKRKILNLGNVIKNEFTLSSHNYKFDEYLNKYRIKNETLSKEAYHFNFLNYHYTNSDANGPLQKDEAILLYGLLKCLRPDVVLEFGFNMGHSSYAILQAIDSSTTLISCDINPKSERIYKDKFQGYSNMKFVYDDMRNLDYKSLLGNRKIDVVFFDAVHDFEINKATFINLKDFLSDTAIILIHDTGIWNMKMINENQKKILPLIKHKLITDGHIAHQIDERIFSNYLVSDFQFRPIHLHTLKTMRHGLTILQKGPAILEV